MSVNKIYFFITIILIAANLVTPAEGGDLNRKELQNGLVILTKPVTTNSIVSVVVSMKMGSLYESDEKSGLCTLMQNTLAKGTSTRTSQQIALDLESVGTRLSASSNREYGTVDLQSTSESLYESLDILFDLLQNATFPEDALELQKNLQIQNIYAMYDQPIYRAMDLMVDAHYGTHPFHKPRMGYPETVKNLQRTDVADIYKRIYIPNNMVISVVGNFDDKRLINEIEHKLGSINRQKNLPPQRRMPSSKSSTG